MRNTVRFGSSAFGVRRSAFGVRRSIGIVAAALVVLCVGDARGQVLNLGIGEVVKEALWNAYPKALVHQPGTFGGKPGPGQHPTRTVRAVLGTPMNAGATPEGAAEAWLGEWSDVFGVLDVTLERMWTVPLIERAEWSIHKSVVRYAQVMGGLPVAGSDVRVVTARQKGLAAGSPGSERVISVEALVLPRPEDGLTPTLSVKDAVEAAKQLRPTHVIWTEPGLLVAARVPGHAALGSHLAYALTGSSPEGDAEVLLIDAHTGELIRSGPANPSCGFRHRGGACGDPSHGHVARGPAVDASSSRVASAGSSAERGIARAADAAAQSKVTSTNAVMITSGEMPPTIRGVVYAWRTPDWWSDTRFLTNPSACLREPEEYAQQEVRMELWDTSGTTLYNTVYTDANGEYSLVCPGTGTFLVRATLGGLNWDVVHFADQVNGCATTPAGEPEPVHKDLASVSSGSTGVDFTFGSSNGTAQEIADTNVHEWVRYCMSYWRSVVPGNSPLNDYFLAWSNHSDVNAFFVRSGSSWKGATWTCSDVLIFGHGIPTAAPVHYGSGTIAAHEFGHLVSLRLELVLPVTYGGTGGVDYPAFSEGYSDATAAVLLPDGLGAVAPTIIGPDLVGDVCGQHLREPLFCDPQFPICFPACNTALPTHCITGTGYSFYYANAVLLGALWMDTRAELGVTDTRALFTDWTFLAVPPGIEFDACECSTIFNQCSPPPCAPDESAAQNTIYEVLLADDDDEDLTNGTPNEEALCAIYGSRSIFLEVDVGACEERVGAPLPSALSTFDDDPTLRLMRFLVAFQAGHPVADVNGDGEIGVLDVEQVIKRLGNSVKGDAK